MAEVLVWIAIACAVTGAHSAGPDGHGLWAPWGIVSAIALGGASFMAGPA